MAHAGNFPELELPMFSLCSANGWGLHFLDQNVERAYCDEALSTMYLQVHRLKRFGFTATTVFFLGMTLYGLITVPWTTKSEAYQAAGGETLVSILVTILAYYFALHMIPKSMAECACCGLTFLYEMLILLSNP